MESIITITKSRLVEILDSYTNEEGVIQLDPVALAEEIFSIAEGDS